MDMDIDLDMGLDMEHNKLDMFIKHVQKSVLCFQASVLHVLLSRCPKLEPQLHSEVLSSCGSSHVDFDVHNVVVAAAKPEDHKRQIHSHVLAPGLTKRHVIQECRRLVWRLSPSAM